MIMLVWGFFKTSLYARLAVVAAVTLGAWQADRAYQRYVGRQQVVKESELAGAKKNVKSGKIRNSIRGDTAMRRLRKEYSNRK